MEILNLLTVKMTAEELLEKFSCGNCWIEIEMERGNRIRL